MINLNNFGCNSNLQMNKNMLKWIPTCERSGLKEVNYIIILKNGIIKLNRSLYPILNYTIKFTSITTAEFCFIETYKYDAT